MRFICKIAFKKQIYYDFLLKIQKKCDGSNMENAFGKRFLRASAVKVRWVGHSADRRKKNTFGRVACRGAQKICVWSGGLLSIAKKKHFIRWPAVDRKKNAFHQVACSRSQKKMRLSQQIAKKNACEVLELFQGTKLSRIFCSDV